MVVQPTCNERKRGRAREGHKRGVELSRVHAEPLTRGPPAYGRMTRLGPQSKGEGLNILGKATEATTVVPGH